MKNVLSQDTGTVAKPNSRDYFRQGDSFPQLVTDWGEVYWQFDGE
jgi:hypothetical protein